MKSIKYIKGWSIGLLVLLLPLMSWAQTNVSLGGSCANCSAVVTSFVNCSSNSSGTLNSGTMIGAGVTQTIVVNVGKVGTYDFSTTANGVSFKAKGSFTGIGSQSIVLTASGKPINAEVTTFTLTSGTQSCTFQRTVDASAPQIAAVCPTNLRFKQISIQWGLTLDGDVYGWNGVLEGLPRQNDYESNSKTLTFTKLQNQPGKISKLMTCRSNKNQGGSSLNEVEYKAFLLGKNGNIYAIERQNDVSGGSGSSPIYYSSPTNLTFVGNAGSGNLRSNSIDMTTFYVTDSRLVIRQFPASPSGSKWKDIEPITDIGGYGVMALDSAGRLYACTWLGTSSTAYTTSWKQIPNPTGAVAGFLYSKMIEHNPMGLYSHGMTVNTNSGSSPTDRAVLLEGSDGDTYAFSVYSLNLVGNTTAFSNTLAKKIPLPAGKKVKKYWNVNVHWSSGTTRSKFFIDLLTTDGTLYTYDYLLNTVVEVTKPQSSTTIIDYVPITQYASDWSSGPPRFDPQSGKGMILTNEGVYENGNNPFFTWKANQQVSTTLSGDAGLQGGWRRSRPEYDFKTLFQQVAYLNPDGSFYIQADHDATYTGNAARRIKRALTLDASGKVYMVTRIDGKGSYIFSTGVTLGSIDGMRETGVFVNELMSGQCDDNNPYPEN
ncbi:SMP-30/gluconolactonase/LRE family protein [Cellulophaga sp. BC115SP]|uniref:SMP-30/gluconolactonase/LRE family protein n=1 Tax=Cellulophaga sp. BC115SP TaxID=2683263 RepID=UPI0014133A2F|nr:SMP-30/gluconolactonase/LRE family protein [Cellulophaga sp. BC115SP]NBB31763.1 hypothetical protein [Cellulophaga sp. BC115SP]